MSEAVIIVRVCPFGSRLQALAAQRGAAFKAVCADRKAPREDQAALLLAWARARGIPDSWIHDSRSGVPHIDLWGWGRRWAR